LIVVTGAGRCGSSLMMQTLHLLGVPMLGDPENDKGRNTLKDYDKSGKIAEKIIDVNPKGYWELPINTLYDNLSYGFGDHCGKAIKVLSGLFTDIDATAVEKVILCRRSNTYKQAEKILELANLDLEIRDSNPDTSPLIEWYRGKTIMDIVLVQDLQLNYTRHIIKTNNIPSLDILFEDIVSNPQEEIEKVVRFLELDVDISRAVENVDVRNETSV